MNLLRQWIILASETKGKEPLSKRSGDWVSNYMNKIIEDIMIAYLNVRSYAIFLLKYYAFLRTILITKRGW